MEEKLTKLRKYRKKKERVRLGVISKMINESTGIDKKVINEVIKQYWQSIHLILKADKDIVVEKVGIFETCDESEHDKSMFGERKFIPARRRMMFKFSARWFKYLPPVLENREDYAKYPKK